MMMVLLWSVFLSFLSSACSGFSARPRIKTPLVVQAAFEDKPIPSPLNLYSAASQAKSLAKDRELTPSTRYSPSQADVTVFKAISTAPDAKTNAHVARWYSHIKSYESEFSTLPGDTSKGVSFCVATIQR